MVHRVIVHAGFHKTGTTAIQTFLGRHRDSLLGAGIIFPVGGYIANNHAEISATCIRQEREIAFKIQNSHPGHSAFPALKLSFERQAQGHEHTILFSAESISFLRFEDELDALDALLPCPGERLFIFYRRNAADWIQSFKAEIAWAGPAKHREAWNYTEDDSWLLRFEERLNAFRRAFGSANVRVVDYDAVVARDRSVIPSFLDLIGIRDRFEPAAWEQLWVNTRSRDAPPPSP